MSKKVDAQMEVGARMRILRDHLHLRQAAMAKRLGVSTSLYSKIEVGIRPMSRFAIERTAAEFGVSIDWLMSGRGPEPSVDFTGQAREPMSQAACNLNQMIKVMSEWFGVDATWLRRWILDGVTEKLKEVRDEDASDDIGDRGADACPSGLGMRTEAEAAAVHADRQGSSEGNASSAGCRRRA